MSFTRNHNVKSAELIDALRLMGKGHLPSNMCLKVVYMLQNDQWRFLLGKCIFDAHEHKETIQKYKEYAFITKPVSDYSLKDFLSSFAEEGFQVCEGFPKINTANQNLNWSQEIVPSHYMETGFPRRKFSASLSSGIGFNDSKLIGYGQDFYPSAHQYIKEFLALAGAGDLQQGQLIIEATDHRGRINIQDQTVSIYGGENDLCITGLTSGGKPIKLTGKESVKLPDIELNDLELWLLTKGNEVLDYWSSSEWPYRYVKAGDKDEQDSYVRIIERGENEHCEFKPYIHLRDGSDPKRVEIEKAVCALSNTNGGHLFIGVNDDAEVTDITKDLARDYRKQDQCTHEEALSRYINDLKKRLRENLKNAECFEIKSMNVYSSLLIVIIVGRSGRVNFLSNPRQAYIRHGASSPKMSPDEMEAKNKSNPLPQLTANI